MELGLTELELASLGNWKSQAEDRSQYQRRLACGMRVRYSDTRLQTAARAKFKCLEAVRLAAQSLDSFD
eukprot:11375477-Karenia_brevis.AAC.1